MKKNYYNEEELRAEGLKFFRGDILATNVWIKKYALKIDGRYMELTPDDTIQRLAKEIFRIESAHPNGLSYNEIYKYLKNFGKFILAGSILFGLGNPINVSLGNCFFVNNGIDSYGGIFQTDEFMAQLMKRRGGVGITLEHLRPEGAIVRNSAQHSTGAVSFMNRYSSTTREVAQDGRRGALMITMHVHHPDIMKFITIKDDLTKVTGANISIKMTDEFMKSVQDDRDFYLHWPVQEKQPVIESQIPYNELHEIGGIYVRRVKAKEVWDQIIKMAHKNAEPGVLFWDKIISESPADMYAKYGFKTEGTNPCGEVTLSHADSCRLGSLNIFAFVKNPFTPNARMDWPALAKGSRFAQRVMDDIVILEEEKIEGILNKIISNSEPESVKKTELLLWNDVLRVLKNGRRTGVGLLGLADAMASLGIKYGSKEASNFGEEIQKIIAVNSYLESVNLAKERGAFPIWDADKESQNPFLMRIISNNFDNKEYDDYLNYGRRNIANLSIAPTGSLAIISQTTSSIEPVFKIFYRRRRKINPGEEGAKVNFVDQNGDSWEEYNVIHYPFIDWYHNKFADDSIQFENSLEYLKNLDEESLNQLVAESPWAGSESHSIDYLEKINMQGAIQKWVDHSISVTHNLPENISIEETNDIYLQGWKAGCKGLTIYREGSRTGVLLTKKEEASDDFSESRAPKRPRYLEADYYAATSKGVKYAVIIGLYKNKPYEIWAFENPPVYKNTRGRVIKVKKGHYKFINGDFEIDSLELAGNREFEKAVTLMASGLLRHGTPIPYVIKTIKKIDENITSFSSVVRRYLSKYVDEIMEVNGESCPHCHDKLITESGCVRCVNPECGYEKCG